mmetsp:Transcript_1044/g.2142  ORF Transcript_1044/g.2142 Transcript_1044/m.2142 type:complete len:323 (-) Transcript_1044:256-1224(-)
MPYRQYPHIGASSADARRGCHRLSARCGCQADPQRVLPRVPLRRLLWSDAVLGALSRVCIQRDGRLAAVQLEAGRAARGAGRRGPDAAHSHGRRRRPQSLGRTLSKDAQIDARDRRARPRQLAAHRHAQRRDPGCWRRSVAPGGRHRGRAHPRPLARLAQLLGGRPPQRRRERPLHGRPPGAQRPPRPPRRLREVRPRPRAAGEIHRQAGRSRLSLDPAWTRKVDALRLCGGAARGRCAVRRGLRARPLWQARRQPAALRRARESGVKSCAHLRLLVFELANCSQVSVCFLYLNCVPCDVGQQLYGQFFVTNPPSRGTSVIV